jgi:hypothetical protein
LRARWSCVDRIKREGTKGGDEALLPIPEPLIPYLKHAIDTSRGALLFPRANGKPRPEKTSMEKVLRRTLARAGILIGYRHTCRRCAAKKKPYSEEHADNELRRCPVKDEVGAVCNMKLWATGLPRWMRFHDLRHTTATLLVKARVPMYVVQKILRHADIKTTVGIYGHLDIEDSREALKSMPAARHSAAGDPDADPDPPSPSGSPDVPSLSQAGAEAQEHEGPGPEIFSETGALNWSGTPDSNRRPSPWQRGSPPSTKLQEATRISTILRFHSGLRCPTRRPVPRIFTRILKPHVPSVCQVAGRETIERRST